MTKTIDPPVVMNDIPGSTTPAEPVPGQRRSTRKTAGKTSKFDDYVAVLCKIANVLCIELPQQELESRASNLMGGGRYWVPTYGNV